MDSNLGTKLLVGTCAAPVPPIKLLSKFTVVKAKTSVTVRWSGGNPSEPVMLRFIWAPGQDFFSGFGIPTAAVSNSGSYIWKVDPGIPSSKTYKVVVISSTDKNNFDLSQGPSAPLPTCNIASHLGFQVRNRASGRTTPTVRFVGLSLLR